MPEQYFPVLLALGVAIALGAVILIASHLLSTLVGNQRGGIVKRSTVESGMPLLDVSHKRISIVFFLVAIDFIVFDLEAAFLYPWSLILREGKMAAVRGCHGLHLPDPGRLRLRLAEGRARPSSAPARERRPQGPLRSTLERSRAFPDPAVAGSRPDPPRPLRGRGRRDRRAAPALPHRPRPPAAGAPHRPEGVRRLAAGRGDRGGRRRARRAGGGRLRGGDLLRPLPPEAGRPAPHPGVHQPLLPAPRLGGNHGGGRSRSSASARTRSRRTAASPSSISSAWAPATRRR